MYIFDINIPDKPLANIEISTYTREWKIPHFRGVFSERYVTTISIQRRVCIVNLNTSNQAGSLCGCYYRIKSDRIYFDSYGQITPVEIQWYLKTGFEFDRGKEVIKIIQIYRYCTTCEYTSVWSPVLKSLTSGENFRRF